MMQLIMNIFPNLQQLFDYSGVVLTGNEHNFSMHAYCFCSQQQYKFIHECLACVLEGREDEATYANLGQVNVGFEGKEMTSLLYS